MTSASVATESGAGRPSAAERILKSARELFYRRGIRAVGVEDIVANAGVTKPSLYRSYSSKDELAAAYLRLYEEEFWARFDAAVAAHPGDPRAQILAYLEGFSDRVAAPNYRGCGLSNAAVEYPEPDHPARLVSEAHKTLLRQRLIQMSRDMGAVEPEVLGDGLFLIFEGTLVSKQIFQSSGPAGQVVQVARLLIKAALEPR
jgi:AcrR family transcriptional regulator